MCVSVCNNYVCLSVCVSVWGYIYVLQFTCKPDACGIYIYMAVRVNEWSILNQGTMYPILEVVRMLDFTGHFICLYHLSYK